MIRIFVIKSKNCDKLVYVVHFLINCLYFSHFFALCAYMLSNHTDPYCFVELFKNYNQIIITIIIALCMRNELRLVT